MVHSLYLDNARLGQMSPAACRASADYSRLVADRGCDQLVCQLLSHGFDFWPEELQSSYPDLMPWQGVTALKRSLQNAMDVPGFSGVHLAARSSTLLRFAARLAGESARRLLMIDANWPTYSAIVRQEANNCFDVATFSARANLFEDDLDAATMAALVVDAFTERGCDSLVLPIIDNFGVRYPVSEIINGIRSRSELRFTILDASQAMGHINFAECIHLADLVIGGCHKWLRAFTPLGVAFSGRPESSKRIQEAFHRYRELRLVDDPIVDFVEELESGCSSLWGETVNAYPLIHAASALNDFEVNADASSSYYQFSRKLDRRWELVSPRLSLGSRIGLVRNRELGRQLNAAQLRNRFSEHGVAITAYDGGLVRISPRVDLGIDQTEQLASAFESVS